MFYDLQIFIQIDENMQIFVQIDENLLTFVEIDENSRKFVGTLQKLYFSINIFVGIPSNVTIFFDSMKIVGNVRKW